MFIICVAKLPTINVLLQEILSPGQSASTEYGWNLILVNQDYKVPKDWDIELTELFKFFGKWRCLSGSKQQRCRHFGGKGENHLIPQQKGGKNMEKFFEPMFERAEARGEVRGEAKGENSLAKLIGCLLSEGKNDTIKEVVENEEIRHILYKEYGIQ